MSRPLRVLHVLDSLGAGGAERSLAEMLPLMQDAGVESQVATLVQRPDGVHQDVEAAGFPVRVLGAARAPATLRLRGLIRETDPDLVHTTLYEGDVLGRTAAAGLSPKVLTSLVNTTYDGVVRADAGIPPWKVEAARVVDAFTARRLTDHFHAISRPVKDSAVVHLGIRPDQVTVIERGRNLDRLGTPSATRRSTVRARLGVDEDAEVVLNIGRQEPQKDQATLLRAVAALAEEHPRLVLLQAGRDGKSSAQLKLLAGELGLGARVRFLGHRTDVGDLLSAADVFAFPSVYEGLGGSVLEAMALRLPIVATRIPALEDVLEHGAGGELVPVGDAESLASAIGGLLAHPDTARDLGRRAEEIFRRRFRLEAITGRMVDLYDRLVSGRPAGERAL